MFLPQGLYEASYPSRDRLTWTPRYEEIRAMQINHLLSIWSSGSCEEVKMLHKNLDEKIESWAAGELKHAGEVISSLWELSRKEGDIPRASPVDCKEVEYIMSPEQEQRERSMRTSLIKSIQGRPLLYRRYWARRSRGGRICPVYFPTAVPGSMLLQVATCEWAYILGLTSNTELDSGRMS